MTGRVLVAVLSIFLLLGAFASPITDGIKTWRTNDTTENFNVTTGAGETGANVTLSYDLYQAATAEVIGITSDNDTDVPVANSYVEATKALEITGLVASDTRVLGVNYYSETDDRVMRILGPFLGILIFGGLISAILYGMWKKGGRRR